MPQQTDALNLLADVIARARRAGADAADAVLVEGASMAHSQRLGNQIPVGRPVLDGGQKQQIEVAFQHFRTHPL